MVENGGESEKICEFVFNQYGLIQSQDRFLYPFVIRFFWGRGHCRETGKCVEAEREWRVAEDHRLDSKRGRYKAQRSNLSICDLSPGCLKLEALTLWDSRSQPLAKSPYVLVDCCSVLVIVECVWMMVRGCSLQSQWVELNLVLLNL